MTTIVNGQVDKVVKIIASSSRSWEDAARKAVSEAAKTVQDLRSAKLVKSDIVVRDQALQYRVKLEMAFQFDRTRVDQRGEAVKVKRYLVVANRTLISADLHELIATKAAESPAEFHVLVPQPVVTSFHADPAGLHDVAMNDGVIQSRAAAREIGEERLAAFRAAVADLDLDLTGEVARRPGAGRPPGARTIELRRDHRVDVAGRRVALAQT